MSFAPHVRDDVDPVDGPDELVHVDLVADQLNNSGSPSYWSDPQGAYPVHQHGRAPLKILVFVADVITKRMHSRLRCRVELSKLGLDNLGQIALHRGPIGDVIRVVIHVVSCMLCYVLKN